MKQTHIVIAALAFLMCFLSAFFGISVYNAQQYVLIDHLNEMDQLNYYSAEDVPGLNFMAATMTVPLVFLILLGEIRILLKTKLQIRKRIAFAALACAATVFVLCLLTFSDPTAWNFNPWGFVWVAMGFFIIVGNMVSFFLRAE